MRIPLIGMLLLVLLAPMACAGELGVLPSTFHGAKARRAAASAKRLALKVDAACQASRPAGPITTKRPNIASRDASKWATYARKLFDECRGDLVAAKEKVDLPKVAGQVTKAEKAAETAKREQERGSDLVESQIAGLEGYYLFGPDAGQTAAMVWKYRLTNKEGEMGLAVGFLGGLTDAEGDADNTISGFVIELATDDDKFGFVGIVRPFDGGVTLNGGIKLNFTSATF